MKPTKRQKQYADRMIAVLRGWKQGKQVQLKSRYSPKWEDVDLLSKIDDTAAKYRIKPNSTRRNKWKRLTS